MADKTVVHGSVIFISKIARQFPSVLTGSSKRQNYSISIIDNIGLNVFYFSGVSIFLKTLTLNDP